MLPNWFCIRLEFMVEENGKRCFVEWWKVLKGCLRSKQTENIIIKADLKEIL